MNDPSAQRPGALPLPTGPPCDRALTITSGSPQASATTGIDSSPATMNGQDQGPARGVSVHFEVATLGFDLGFPLALLDYLRLDRVSVGAVPDPRGPFSA